MYKIIILGFGLLLMSHTLQASAILSGQVKAADNQTFYAPKTGNWKVQVQWILPEGEVAQEGDLVMVFDSGTIQSEIEQLKASLISAEEELYRIKSSNEQSLLEARYGKKRTELLLTKSRIDASVSADYLSQYDYKKNQLEFEKAVIADVKAQATLKQTKVANKVALTKQKITIKKYQQQLKYNQNKFKKMSVYAQRTGPVLYANHPWSGEKIFVGMTAQPAWKIAEIPSLNGLYIEAWVHEVDHKNLILNSRAKLKFDAYPNTVLLAKLADISTQPEVQKEWGNDVYYRTVFEFDANTDFKVLPGMSAQKELDNKKIKEIATEQELILAVAEKKMEFEKAKRKAEVFDNSRSENDMKKSEIDFTVAQNDLFLSQEKLNFHKKNSLLNLKLAQGRVDRLTAEIDDFNKDIERLKVKAPMDGMVIYKANWEGEKPAVGESIQFGQPILELAVIELMQLKAQVAESDSGKLVLGQKVKIILDGTQEQTFSGKVVNLGRVFRSKSAQDKKRILDTIIEFDETNSSVMRPGMTARIEVITKVLDKALTLPIKAVKDLSDSKVITLESGVEKQVEVAYIIGNKVVLAKGVKQGERVAL